MSDIIKDFFEKKFETESTKLLINEKSLFSKEAMVDFIRNILSYPIQEYLNLMPSFMSHSEIKSGDITQLSSISDCTENICKVMLSFENKGFTLSEIATYLHADRQYENNLIALKKYGENQVKTASQLGLCVLQNGLWYLSAIGYVFLDLDEHDRNKILSLNLLRDPFYSNIITSLCKRDTNLLDYMNILSESTKKRRASSCYKILHFFIQQCKYEGLTIYKLTYK